MRRAALLGVAAILALAGCGSQAPCAAPQNGEQLCGSALVSWCEQNHVGLDQAYPPGSPMLKACQAAGRWSTRGQHVITITPQNVGKYVP